MSADCADLLEGLLRRDPQHRISFDQFFNAPFLLPLPPLPDDDPPRPPPHGDGGLEASGSPKQPLVTHDMTWHDSGGSDEYVLVEREYEDIGREVLQDAADDLAALPNEEQVALFVPTPLGDYIAFHEGCPHYYLSAESIQAANRGNRKPAYVLGCLVFIEDGEAGETVPHTI
ncbi:hypothetical protein DYB34_011448 [Aphanomyces astaci]|nr:hypothetical protein DYB34_011448 [Aphanomyces astaci]